jgi:superfamily II DNA/RNA helicase
MLFKELNLNENLLRAIDKCGYSEATAIQQQAIPVVLEGHDLMASAQTGTGKTAAFVLPALQKFQTPSSKKGNGPRMLVLTPTRELAMQVSDNVGQFGRFSQVVAGSIVGGMSYPPQIKMLRRSLDILVATPGRLMDHMEQGRIDFSRLEILVLDEADRMLDMGFIDDIRKIAAKTPRDRQTLLFSATLEGKILNIAKQLLNNPQKIQLASNKNRHESIKQHLHQADDFSHKNRLLAHYVGCDSLSQAVIFTATKRGADKLSKQLAAQGHKSAALHGDMGQGARKRTIEQMRGGKFRLLVATDVAARGLDINGISHVFNFDLPMVAEDYVHRIGRTGRAGRKGTAVSFVGPDDWSKLSGIERLTGKRLERDVIDGLEPRSSEPRPGSSRGKGNYRGAGNGARNGKKAGPKVSYKKRGKSGDRKAASANGKSGNFRGGKPGNKTSPRRSQPSSATA